MNFYRTNNIIGWIVCLVACSVYIITMEKTGSFWDCGEFVSSAYKLEIPHPPGAPLFVLLGRIFTLPFDVASIGVNLLSALSSGFTILFLFWTITHFARKLVVSANQSVTRVEGSKLSGELEQSNYDYLSGTQMFSIMAAGVVGALAYTFSDSFWYSAVEGEVYALSSFFTAIVFWAICKWEHEVTAEKARGITARFTRADRWLILIFYLMGLSIGVHLLNLLTLPAIIMVYYFKRFNVTKWGTFWAFVTGCVITGIVQKVVIVWTISNAGTFDIIFKNDFGLPFFVGFGFYFLILASLIVIGLRFKENKVTHTQMLIWAIALLAFLVLPELLKSNETGIGGKALMRILILAVGAIAAYLAKPTSLRYIKLSLWCLGFMLLGYSTYFTTLIRSNADPVIDMFNVDNPVNLVGYLSREQYGDWPIIYGQDFTSQEKERKSIPTYVKGKDKYELTGRKVEFVYDAADKHLFPRMWDASNDQGHADYYANFMGMSRNEDGSWPSSPTMKDNIGFFLSYQVNWMYLRYFMWNFAGKQNDVQGLYMGNGRDGNWKTGIGFLDNMRLGNQELLPDSLKNNKANNSLFALPLILGIMGIIYLYMKNKRDLLVTGFLFFFTGFAIVLYLNQAGMQPRERDYAYVGSFYAFAIWIGLGVLWVKDLFYKVFKNNNTSNYAAALVCFAAVPLLMAFQEWDDHDRGRKVLARDLAIDYLESCAPNAIVISFGDNDTYPLWYAQEVENVRPDVRVINSSLLGTDWYINQLRYKLNDSDPVDVVWTEDQIIGSRRDGIYYYPSLPGYDPNTPMDLYTMMKDVAGSDDVNKMVMDPGGEDYLNVFPTRKLRVAVDQAVVRQNGTVNVSDSVVSELQFELPSNKFALGKNESAILNIIAGNKWKRPIYFTSPYDELGFGQYLRSDGLTYRLVPVRNSEINSNWVFDKMMNKFKFGNADKKGVYFDEENRRHLNTLRMNFAMSASKLADENRKEDAKKLLNRADKNMLSENFPYGMASRGQNHNQIAAQFYLACLKAGDSVLANKVGTMIRKDLNQQIAFFNSLDENKQILLSRDNDAAMGLLQQLDQMDQYFKNVAVPIDPEKGTTITNNPTPADSPKK